MMKWIAWILAALFGLSVFGLTGGCKGSLKIPGIGYVDCTMQADEPKEESEEP